MKIYIILLIIIALSLISCQKDNYNTAKPISQRFDYLIPTIATIRFEQFSENLKTVVPYTSNLIIFNNGETVLNLQGQILSFKDDTLKYSKLNYISQITTESLAVKDSTSLLPLSKIDNLINSKNTMIVPLSINEIKHKLSGLFKGEIDIFNVETDQYIKTLKVIVLIDYIGQFHLFSLSGEEQSIVRMDGVFNDSLMVSGTIFNFSGDMFSKYKNDTENPFQYQGQNLTGSVIFTDPSTQSDFRLQITLTK